MPHQPDPEALQHWFSSPGGRQLVEREASQVQAVLPSLIGCRLLQIGSWGLDADMFQGGSILQHWVLGLTSAPGVHACIDGRSLPVASRSVDTVLLPHSLELVSSPHRLLREVDRVLCNHGHVIIQGFNPLGFWAMRQGLPWGKQRFPKEGARFYTQNRVRDWLELLDFDIIEVRRYGARYPANRPSPEAGDVMGLLYAPLCQGYLVLARKRVIPLSPLRQRRASPRVVVPAALPEARVHRSR